MLKCGRHVVLMLIMVIVCNLGLPMVWAVPIAVFPVEQNETPPVDIALPVQTENVPRAKIPESPVHMYIKNGQESRFEVFFLDVKYDYDLVDFETYKAWCLQKRQPIRRDAMHEVMLYNCYDSNIPEQFKRTDWNQINYIINHKNGSKEVTQEAIWALCDGGNAPESQEAVQLLNEAALKGRDFRPAEGDLLGVIGYAKGKQPVLIEFLVPKSEVFDVAPAFFEPALAALPAASPSLLPLAPLAVVPAIPFIPPGPPPSPPPSPPSVPEPVTFFLFGSGFVCLIGLRLNSLRRER